MTEFDDFQKAEIEKARARSEAAALIPIEALAAKLGVSVRTIRRLHASGNGPPRVRRGHKLMYQESAVDSWLQSRGLRRK